MQKALIRKDMLALRQRLPAGTCLDWSRRIQDSLLRLPEFVAARSVALYSAIRNEVSTSAIFEAAREQGKLVCYPKISQGRLDFIPVSCERELESGSFGIPEPRGTAGIPIGDLDFLVIPGIVFDRGGHRLGYGKGFYDRILHDPQERGILVGLCYEMQLIESLPAALHDVRMDLLVTENQVLRFHRSPPLASPLEEDLP